MRALVTILVFISTLFGWVAEITALKGGADVVRNNQTLPASLHMKLEKTDVIKTKQNTKLQLVFKDDTIITIGKNSEVKIEDYLFDNENSKAKFRLKYGIMKTLTGKIGKFAPKRFKVMTKNASIGIRGTYFVVESYENIIKVGMISGEVEFVNLDNMRSYIVKKGEQLIFDITKPKNVEINSHFLEPLSTKIKALPSKINSIEKNIENIQNTAIKESKSVTTSETSHSKVYSGFIEGVLKKTIK